MEDTTIEELELPKLKCLREECGHEWYPRSNKKPRLCPKCKHEDWDNPRPKKHLQGVAEPVISKGE